ncbi:MAG: LPS export ABC transporter periplasmic protein LptC [Ekhidna sp.]|uniref:LPS export ABC transporter periplasmic protein LptC n=1 Tax=Ekhidna sp. TaxID=2608089 RepID=UPI0032EF56E7
MSEDLRINITTKKNTIAAWKSLSGRFLVLGLWLILLACNQRKDLVDAPLYEGPLSSMDSAITLLSDSGIVVMQMNANRQNNFENGDREWPEGLYIEWYNRRGQVTSYFRANYVYFTKSENLYRAEGNVVIKSNAKNDELNTEELFWDQAEEKFYTDKFVTINSDGEVHTGEGMESNQDFTEYRILKPSGTFRLEDDPGNPSETDILIKPTPQRQ